MNKQRKPAPQSKYFIALIPPEPYYRKAWEWKEWFRQHYQTTKALNSPPHITLQMPFRWKEKREAELVNLLANFARTQQGFSIALNGFAAFPPRVIYLDVLNTPPLLSLQKELTRSLRRELGIHHATHKDNGFVPHLTVAFRDLKKGAFELAWERVSRLEEQHEYVQEDVSLLKHDGNGWQEFQKFHFGKR